MIVFSIKTVTLKNFDMERRKFIRNGLLTGAAALSGLTLTAHAGAEAEKKMASPFTMKFSPEFGIFAGVAGTDLVDQIKWGHDQGFRAWESTGLKGRSTQDQERISNTIRQLGMEF